MSEYGFAAPEGFETYEPNYSADGVLTVFVDSAKDLPNRRKLDKQCPYVTLRIGPTARKTPAVFRGGQRPQWNHELQFDLTRDRKPVITLDVLDETKNDPTPIGHADVDCSEVMHPVNEVDGVYRMRRSYPLELNGRSAGSIILDMTFHPSAPVLPPKIPVDATGYEVANSYDFHDQENDREDRYQHMISRSPSPPREAFSPRTSQNGQQSHQVKQRNVTDDIFVNEEDTKKNKTFSSFMSASMSSSRSSNAYSSKANRDVFVGVAQEEHSLKPGKFLKKINKLFNKENMSNFAWHEPSNSITPVDSSPSKRITSPISQYGVEDDENVVSPSVPSPPPHLVESDHLKKPVSHSRASSKSPHRKPPSDYTEDFRKMHMSSTTSIPFSADSIGGEDPVPTKVFLLDKQITSLSRNKDLPPDVNPDDIGIAPSPSEHFTRQRRLKDGYGITNDDLKVDLRTDRTGYLGDGRFSPSVFQRIDHFDLDGDEDKPPVPPKTPMGLTAKEYYATNREGYLKDINGRRF
ncbi:uncharacterized protein RJT20DRAFT_45056 [Scheffersomyces xylosifermentans]|uniref:uncharacterized protein n=1 Tax=Scheffersomyces xylosifermentans TaxID=1304137 RepID=UPI00315DD053